MHYINQKLVTIIAFLFTILLYMEFSSWEKKEQNTWRLDTDPYDVRNYLLYILQYKFITVDSRDQTKSN